MPYFHSLYSVNNSFCVGGSPPFLAKGFLALLLLLCLSPACIDFARAESPAQKADSLLKVIAQRSTEIEKRSVLQNLFEVENERMEQQAIKLTLLGLVPVLVAFGFIVVVLMVKRRELQHQQRESLLKTTAAELESKALRAQMNPHFVFNCMNAIYRSMEDGKTTQASHYLIKFANLMRGILENSRHLEVSIMDELKVLRSYLEMEQMRSEGKFEFAIEVDETLPLEDIFLPPMLMQPFLENSIWHGMHKRSGGGQIHISLESNEGYFEMKIWDNGSFNDENPVAPALSEEKKSSLGMALLRERVNAMRELKEVDAFLIEKDLIDENGSYLGKQIMFRISLKDAVG